MSSVDESGTDLPLKGVKVIEMGSLIAGPYAASLLAQFGAEVIKIEQTKSGDPLRNWRMMYKGTSLWWYSQNRNKKSITLDLKSDEGKDIVKKLVKEADIVIENFKPKTLEKLGLGWDTLSEINPKLIMVRVSGYGQNGPYSSSPGFAAISESMGGLRYLSGYQDRAPVRVGVSLGDTLASLYGTIGALIALHHLKNNHGKGQYVDVALYEASFAITESLISEYAMFGHVRERTGASLPGISPSNTYMTQEGEYVIIAGNSDAIFKRLMSVIGRLDIAESLDYATNAKRVKHNAFIDNLISEWTSQHTIDEVLTELNLHDIPCGRVYTVVDMASDPQYVAREMIEKHSLEDGTEISIPGIVPKLSATPGKTLQLGPKLGEHNNDVLSALGYSMEEINELRIREVI